MKKIISKTSLILSIILTLGFPIGFLIKDMLEIHKTRNIPFLPIMFIAIFITSFIRIKLKEKEKTTDYKNQARIIKGEKTDYSSFYNKLYFYPLVIVIGLYALIWCVDNWANNILEQLQLYLGLFLGGNVSYQISKAVK